jgi:hypothetical protein
MLATIELGAEAALWAKENAKPILAGSTILFMGLWSRSCLQSNELSLRLEACLKQEPTVQTVYVKQDCKQSVKIVYKDGSPCPDVAVDNSSDFVASITQTAKASGYADLWHPSAGVGYSLPRIGGYEFGVQVDASALAFSGEPGLYPAYGAKLTVRR